jgi:hypothetical protein
VAFGERGLLKTGTSVPRFPNKYPKKFNT